MQNEPQAITVEVSKLTLKPGDILVLRSDAKLSMEELENIQATLAGLPLNGAKAVILDAGMKLEVIEQETERPGDA